MEKQRLEKHIVAAIHTELTKRGIFHHKIHGGPYQGAGLPDIIAIAPVTGRFVGIEVKRPKTGILTELQRRTLEKIREAGGVAGVACTVSEAVRLVEEGSGA